MQSTEAIKQKSVGGAVSYTVRTGAVYVIALVATGLLSAYLTPAQFGVFFIVSAIITFFTFLSDVGLAAALVQKDTNLTLTELRTTFTVQQALAFLIFSLIIVLTPFWQEYTKLSPEGLKLLYALGFSFFLASLKTIPSILLERDLDFHKLAIPQVIEQLVFYSVVVLLAYNGFGVSSFTYGVIARGIVGVIVMYSLKRWPIGLSLNREALRGLLKFGVKFQANDLLARLKDDLYFVVLARFLPTTVMGYLGWAKRWSMFPYQFSVQNIIAITFPTIARIQDNKKMVARGLELSLYFISLIIFPLLMGMVVLALPLIQAIPVYFKWLPALPSLYFFCLNIGFAAIANPFISALNAMGKINSTLKLMITITLLTWGLTPLAVGIWGFVGVAIVSVVAAALSLYGIWAIKRLLSVNLVKNIWGQGLAALIMGISLWGLFGMIPNTILSLVMGVMVGGIIYLGMVCLVGYKTLIANIQLIRTK